MSEHINLAELREAATRKSPPLMLTDQARLLALVEAVEAAQAYEAVASYDFYPDSRVEARVRLRAALAPFAPAASVPQKETGE